MSLVVDLEKLDRIHHLIRRKATGTPDELARRIGMSVSRLYQILSYLRDEMHAPINYSRINCSYEYEFPTNFNLDFNRERLYQTEIETVSGGNNNSDKTENILYKYDLQEVNQFINKAYDIQKDIG